MGSIFQVSIISGEIISKSTHTGEEMWRGKPLDIYVVKILPIPGSEEFIVLLRYIEAWEKKRKNLLRITPIGKIIWEVGSPVEKKYFGLTRESLEYYSGASIEGNVVIAYATSGFSDQVDIETGKILHSEFVK